jgi:hypothetical protein
MLQQGLGWVLEELAHETRRRPGEPVRGSVGVMLDHASNGAGGVRHPQQILNLVKDDEAAALRALMKRGWKLEQALGHALDVHVA